MAGGQTISAEFTINSGGAPVVFDILTVGGRLGQTGIDFPWQQGVTLNSNSSHTYKGSLTLKTPGTYHFFTAYRTKDGQWNTAIPTVSGVTNILDLTVTATVVPPSTVQLNPHVIVGPYSGPHGTAFNQPGQGFTPNSSVTVYLRRPDGIQILAQKRTTDAQGQYSNAWTAPQDAMAGMYQSWAVDDRTGRQSDVVTFTVIASAPGYGPSPTQTQSYPVGSAPPSSIYPKTGVPQTGLQSPQPGSTPSPKTIYPPSPIPQPIPQTPATAQKTVPAITPSSPSSSSQPKTAPCSSGQQ